MTRIKLFLSLLLIITISIVFKVVESLQTVGLDIKIPPTLEGDRVLTLNDTGYIHYTLTPLNEKFITEEALPHNDLLEIGSGFSNVAIESLKKGVNSYTANDILKEHLDILVARAKLEFGQNSERVLKSLKLLPAEAPEQLHLANNQYDAILADKVLQFMTPSKIDSFLSWSRKALKRNGKIYIATIPPTNISVREKLLPEYMERTKNEGIYAGYFEDMLPYLNEEYREKYTKKPSKDSKGTTLFTRENLKKFLEDHGFEVLETYALRLVGDGKDHFMWSNVKDEESDLVGVIAISP
ncbi:MAG: class I SAM-dependent methyltransferase [Alphaproteobacteria bacterium]|nr:class I SAM-dependent methyltransferase [Alphaproteobacteria bacterium]